jgi:hypothetical protein
MAAPARTRLIRAWQFFRTIGKIDGINAVAKEMAGLENSHRGGLPGFIATPPYQVSEGKYFQYPYND